MSGRSEELRRRGRRIFWYSMLAAAAVHVVIFVTSPEFETKPLPDSRVEKVEEEMGDGATGTEFIDVFFGRPEILRADGTISKEPPERVLEARAVDFSGLDLSFECSRKQMGEMVPAAGRVRLVLDADGRVEEESVADGSGDPCRDEMLTAIASKVTYEWLPNQVFPPPVELIQPMRVVVSAL